MPSLLPHYAYDIFISYRHNDNRTGWVTEFVAALQEELASTIKEPVSVYFDTNSYDGLLETHQVDKSLEGKLKCLIFIPIISQTYCDPKSFAWQHEFCAFNRLSRAEAMGRDITLGNGNVASRILPVRIHNLEPADRATLENEIGGVLRAVDFVYLEPGVNRPLKALDQRSHNQNKTSYGNQLNKIANAIKEIVYALARPSAEQSFAKSTSLPVSGSDARPSIVVLPFANLNHDPEQEYFSDGITENIISSLASNKELRIISRTSAMRYKNAGKSAREIAEELNVQYILEGGVQSSGKKMRINVQLVEAATDDLSWSKVFMESLDDLFEVQHNVSEAVVNELKAYIAIEPKPKEDTPTANQEAYTLFLKGRHAFNQWSTEGYRVASDYYEKALALDPEFKQAYSSLASAYSARMSWNGDLSPGEAKPKIEKYLAEAWKRGPSENDYLTKAFLEFFIAKDFSAAEKFLLQAIASGPNNSDACYTYSYLLNMMGRFEEALQWLAKAKSIDPLTVAYFNFQVINQHLLGQQEEALLTVQEGLRLYPAVIRFYDFMARIYLTMEKWEEAKDAVTRGFAITKLRPPSMVAYLAMAYKALNQPVKSQELFDELIRRSTENEKGVNIYIVHVFNARGELPAAQEYLKKARKSNDIDLIWWEVDPLLKTIREQSKNDNNPDFEAAEKHITALLEKEMPRLPYHNYDHIKDVLSAAMAIGASEQLDKTEMHMLRIAALLHDAGFIRSPKNHEVRGAEMTEAILPAFGFSADQIEVIKSMILTTRLPQSPVTKLEKILCDADLDYLGRDDFYEIGDRLFEEMKAHGVIQSEREWNLVQKTFFESHRFHTAYSKANRSASKQARLEEIILKLSV